MSESTLHTVMLKISNKSFLFKISLGSDRLLGKLYRYVFLNMLFKLEYKFFQKKKVKEHLNKDFFNRFLLENFS
jgi:hypothetical protein